MASVNLKSSGECVLVCISKANDDCRRSFLYVCKLVNEDNVIEQGNPVYLVNPRSKMDLWENVDVWRAGLRFGEVIKFRIEDNSCVYVGKTGKKIMSIDQIQMGLDFEVNCYRGISDACPGAEFLPCSGNFNHCYIRGKPEKDQIFIIAIASGEILDEKISLSTRIGEHVILKLNCRENLTMSTAPLHLRMKQWKDEDVGDVAIIKFIESFGGPLQTSYIAVCEGLILRYKPKVISVEEEPVEIMNAKGIFVYCPGVVTFDTGNDIATAISGKLVKKLNLEDRIDHTNKTVVARGNPFSKLCSTIKINIKICQSKFSVEALYGILPENTDLSIGMGIINELFDHGFALGK